MDCTDACATTIASESMTEVQTVSRGLSWAVFLLDFRRDPKSRVAELTAKRAAQILAVDFRTVN